MSGRLSFVLILGILCVLSCGDRGPSTDDRAQSLAARAAEAIVDKEYEKARSLLEEAVSLKPDFAEAWVGHGQSCALMGDSVSARESYERALELHSQRYREDSRDANQLVQQVFVLFLLGRETQARDLLAQGLEAHPADEQLNLFSSGMDSLLTDGEFSKLRVQQ
jgi:Flp pilus assembly protein TadD